MKIDTQITGNKGLYYTCYHLSQLHWNVMPTSSNARGVDVIAYDLAATRFLGIQIKSLSKKSPVPLGKSLDKMMGDWWIIINDLTKTPRAYILKPEEVARLAHQGEKEGRISYWLQPQDYAVPEYEEAWARIGRGDYNKEGEQVGAGDAEEAV